MTAKCEIYQEESEAENPGWRWRLMSRNGKNIANGSESYITKYKAHEAFIRAANLAETAEVKFI